MMLAVTWNGNESGTLWERLWVVDSDGLHTIKVCASGVFAPPTPFADASAFWEAFEDDRRRFHSVAYIEPRAQTEEETT
jgi:hypothetical protein